MARTNWLNAVLCAFLFLFMSAFERLTQSRDLESGRLGRILNPLLGGAGKAVMNGHAQANNFRRELEVEDDLAARGALCVQQYNPNSRLKY